MEAGGLNTLLQAHEVGVCSRGTEVGMQPAALSVSPRTNRNSALGSDPGSLLPKRNNREVLISCSCGVFLLNFLVLFSQCLMLCSTTIWLTKCQRLSAKGNVSLIVCCFPADCTGNRLYRKANASQLVASCWMNIRFSEQGFCKSVGTLSIWKGVPVSKQIWPPVSGCVGCFLEDGTFKICPCKHGC